MLHSSPPNVVSSATEGFFSGIRENIIGREQTFRSPYGQKKIRYADWTASGRAYGPIEDFIREAIMPFIGNTHTGSTVTGTLMSAAYEEAKTVIKTHVNAGPDDVLVFCGSGMTAAVNKLQRMLGMRIPGRVMDYLRQDDSGSKVYANAAACDPLTRFAVDETLRPVVFITHMEHHSNQVSWLETIATVEIIAADGNGNVDLHHFETLLEKYRHRKNKIAAVTACSNVTGIMTPYHDIAKLVHAQGGLCFVDFACAAPYVDMDMHPAEKDAHLDAIYFSPHKFLGGPGTPGVLVFNQSMYGDQVPDQPGGGTVVYSNPWGGHEYVRDVEQREDGGTPPLLQAIKAAMCIRLKEKMGVENIRLREAEILEAMFERFDKMENVLVLQGDKKQRLGIVSFIVRGVHHNLVVKLLNDRFGVQARGGCSCAGTYGHFLLRVDRSRSEQILEAIRRGDLFCKPGWVRISIHPTMTDTDIGQIMDAVELTARHCAAWAADYSYDPLSGEYIFDGIQHEMKPAVSDWFRASNW